MDTIGTTYYSSSIDELIQKTHERALDVGRQSAKDLALLNKPKPPEEKLDGYTGSLTSMYNSLASQVASKSGVEQAIQNRVTRTKYYTEREQELKASTEELSNKTVKLKSQLDGMNIEPTKVRIRLWQFLIHPLIVILLFGESVLNQESLSLLNSSGLIFRLLLSITLSVVLYLLIWAKFIIWHKAKHGAMKWSVLSVLAIIVIVSMIGLASMRIDYVNSMPGMSVDVSIHLLIGINILFYSSSLVGKIYFGITPDEKAHYKKFKQRSKEYTQLINKLNTEEKELLELPINRDEELSECQSIILMGKYYQDYIQNLP